MAHHNSTPPRSILDAPSSVRIVIIRHTGKNRAERRYHYGKNFRNAPVTNKPFLGHHGNKAVRDA